MPLVTRNGVRLYCKLEGADNRPVLVLLNSIGTDMSPWDAAARDLTFAFRLLRVDTRGHGASDAPEGEYGLAMLADDAVAAMDAADVECAAVTGVSLGGIITRIACHEIWGRPGLDDRTRRLIVLVITASLGLLEEFALHVRAGLNRGGSSADELKEALMQTAIYACVPAREFCFLRSWQDHCRTQRW